MASDTLTHIGPDGRARMVDVGDKPQTLRTAMAEGFIRAKPATIALVRDGKAKKGDVLTVAELAGIMGAKKTADLIPLCHPLPLSSVKVRIEIEEAGFRVTTETRTTGQTGVEMEALTAVSTSALTVYDMLKAVDKAMVIERIQLLEKTGGVSGDFRRED